MSTRNQVFTGAHVSRQAINLGGLNRSDTNSQADLVARAKQQREEREDQRRRDTSAVKVQAFYRGRHEAARARAVLRARYDVLMATGVDSKVVMEASKLLALFFVDGNAGDLKRAALWCRTVLGTSGTDKTPWLFSLYRVDAPSWSVILRQITKVLFYQATTRPSTPQAPLFLEITKMVCDPASYMKWNVGNVLGKTTLEYLLVGGFYDRLRGLLLAIPTSNRTHPALAVTISLSLLPFKVSNPATTTSPTLSSPSFIASLSSFTSFILTIPTLPHRISATSLAALSTLPWEDLVLNLSNHSIASMLVGLGVEDAANLLANFVKLVGSKVATISTGKVLAGWFTFVTACLDRIPVELLVPVKEHVEMSTGKGKGKEVEVIVIDDSDDDMEDVIVGPAPGLKATQRNTTMAPLTTIPILSLDPRTVSTLLSIPSRTSLLPLLTLSTRFSASTRPALASYLVSLLQTIPSQREAVLNTIMYGPSANAGAIAERGGGLLREVWRGYVRTSGLGKLLGSGEKERSSAVLYSLKDKVYANDWPSLILLTELYSRCLLTLGDDEYYSPKNPLTLDEVVGLSAMLRNLAFALYWQEGSLGLMAGREGDGVGGGRMGAEAVRTLATTLLQQIHARDSRRSFTPPDFWLMTSQFDLASFIQTVVYEEEKLEAEGEEEALPPMEEDEDGLAPRRPTASAKVSLSKRQMAFISPRLGVLNNIPFVIPFETRVAIFRQFISNDRKRLGIERHIYNRQKRHRAVVRRAHISEDSYAHLNGLGAALKGTIEIVFIDEHGMEESGIDGGGLFKELLTSLSKEAFDTDRGLWLATKEQELYPNPHSYARESTQLSWYTFIGRILGKALYEGILIDVRFAGFFLAKWLGRQSYLDDLASLDPELYNGLMFLKNYTGDVEADLSLNFSITDDDFGVSRTIDLIAGGSEIPVTNENRIQYIYLTSHYRLNSQIEKQCAAFFSGLSEIIPERFLRMFNQAELRMLVGGVDQAIDLEDLKANTVYGGWPNDEANATIRAFWSVVSTFSKADMASLLKFVTSCARPPLLGFRELNPRFAIRAAGKDETRLPTSSTCVNLLKLPEYTDEANLRQKLLYAISSGAGFDLS